MLYDETLIVLCSNISLIIIFLDHYARSLKKLFLQVSLSEIFSLIYLLVSFTLLYRVFLDSCHEKNYMGERIYLENPT